MSQERSLIKGKKSCHSLGSLNITKKSLPSGSIHNNGSYSSSSHLRNPTQESSQGRVSGLSSLPKKASGAGEIKTTVTVGRSATVAGDIKVLGYFTNLTRKVLLISVVLIAMVLNISLYNILKPLFISNAWMLE